MNLREVDLTLSYTDGDVTATTGVDNVVTHRPDVQTIQAGVEGHAYFDFDEHFLNREGTTTDGPYGAMSLLMQGGSQGKWAVVFFDEPSYTNDTVVDGAVLTGWMSTYGLVVEETGTPNTQGFIPGTGGQWHGFERLDQSYISWSQNGTSSETGTAYIVAAPLVNNISAGVGYKKTDFDLEAQYAKVYQVDIE